MFICTFDTGDFRQDKNTDHRDESEDKLLFFPMSCLENICVREYMSIMLFDPPSCIEGRVLYRHHLTPYDRWTVSAVAFGAAIMTFNVVYVP
jgi:hypothetical protein